MTLINTHPDRPIDRKPLADAGLQDGHIGIVERNVNPARDKTLCQVFEAQLKSAARKLPHGLVPRLRSVAVSIIASLFLVSTVFAQTNVGPFWIGFGSGGQDYGVTTTNLQMNASGEGVGAVFVIPKSGEIDQILIIPGAVGTSESCTVRIETVSAGLPTGTLYDTGAGGGVIATQTADATATATFSGATVTATAGDKVAFIVEHTSFSAGDVSWRIWQAGGVSAWPYVIHDSGAGYAKIAARIPMFVLHYTDGSYVVPAGCVPPGRIASVNIQSDTTPDEIAFQFTAPIAMRLTALCFLSREFGATDLIDFEVFDDQATPASLTTNDTNITHNETGLNNTFATVVLEPESLTTSQVINASIFSNDATNNLQIYYYEVDDANYWGDFARNIFWATRTDAGAFTETTTRKPIGGLWFDQITAGASVAIDPVVTSQ